MKLKTLLKINMLLSGIGGICGGLIFLIFDYTFLDWQWYMIMIPSVFSILYLSNAVYYFIKYKKEQKNERIKSKD